MSLIDVLDSKGNPIGIAKTIEQLHMDNDIHRTVHVWIINDKNEFLLQLRSPNMVTHPNEWDISSAGHVDSGESSIEAALRELQEELGVQCNSDELQYMFTIDCSNRKQNKEFRDVYLMRCNKNIEEFKIDKVEVSDIKWVPFNALKEMVNKNDTHLVKRPEEYAKLFKELNI